MAKGLAAAGAKIVINGRSQDGVDEGIKKLKAEGLSAAGAIFDVTKPKDIVVAVKKVEENVGPIDILVNAAGFVHHGTVLDCDDKAWEFSFDLNVKSMHRTIKAFLPGMLAAGKGSIVNIASGAGSVRGIPNRYVYGATKAAVIGLTKAVAADYIKKGVRANAICPGTIQSPSLDQRIKDLAQATKTTEAAARQAFIDRQPMGRLGTAEEIAWLAVYLGSDEASYTTGQIHLADGGFAL
jgi:2-keto-3-deoxy-L-fuconate dehydrogenase